MQITVTGAAGRLGSALCRQLHEQGYTVRAVDRMARPELPFPVEVADLLNPDTAGRLLEGSQAVVHLANHAKYYETGPRRQQCFNENVSINMNVFQAAVDLGVAKVIFASTIQVIGSHRTVGKPEQEFRPAYLPLDGQTPANPQNSYALSKALSEQTLEHFARLAGLESVAVRFPLLLKEEELPKAKEVKEEELWAQEAFAYLAYTDAAALIESCLRAKLEGFRTFLPSAGLPPGGKTVPELIAAYYSNVPLRKPAGELAGFVDVAHIQKETGWGPPAGHPFIPSSSACSRP